MVFSPPKSTGLAFGLGGIALLLLLDIGLVALIRATSLSILTFIYFCLLLLSLIAIAWLGYRSYGLARARYVLSRNALVTEWGERRELLPMQAIEEVRAGAEFEGRLRPRGLWWPGCMVGRADIPALGFVEFFAASDKAGIVLVGHTNGWLAISPSEPQAFIQIFTERRLEGISAHVESESRRARLERWAVRRDRLAVGLIALGGLSVLLLVGYLLLIFPQLPPEIALHFNAQGQPDRFGPPTGLFILPFIGGLAWVLNTLGGLWLHHRESERAGAYLLFGATVFVQALVWVAVSGLLTAGR